MRYRVSHTTRYHYGDAVTLCHNEARLAPRDTLAQTCERVVFHIDPPPKVFRERADYFGNRVHYFGIEQGHRELSVQVVSDVQTQQVSMVLGMGEPWEHAVALISQPQTPELRAVRQYLYASPLIGPLPALTDYARASFPAGGSAVDCVADLMHRIHEDFTFDPVATSVATPLSRSFELRRGVCQDFAHVAIAALRSIGLPARYVSGYLETLPPPGRPKLVGADASHAWFEAYVPDAGWIAFDPTNDQMPTMQYVTVAVGRDYSDVAPLKGVIFGGGHHTLSVAVDVTQLA